MKHDLISCAINLTKKNDKALLVKHFLPQMDVHFQLIYRLPNHFLAVFMQLFYEVVCLIISSFNLAWIKLYCFVC